MTQYQLRQIGRKLKAGEARIEGKVSGGQRWPDEPYYYIVDDCVEQETLHVLCDDRPRWERYYRAYITA